MVFGPSLVSETSFLLGVFLVYDPGPTVGLHMVCSKNVWVKVNISYFLSYPLIAMLAVNFVVSRENLHQHPIGHTLKLLGGKTIKHSDVRLKVIVILRTFMD